MKSKEEYYLAMMENSSVVHKKVNEIGEILSEYPGPLIDIVIVSQKIKELIEFSFFCGFDAARLEQQIEKERTSCEARPTPLFNERDED